MPCNADYMEPNAAEANSRKVARLLAYILTSQGKTVPAAITAGAGRYYGYGNVDKLNEWTAQLCELCDAMTPTQRATIIYDGRKALARELAGWWEEHQKADREREASEQAATKRAALRKTALAKLNAAEREALGL